MKLNYIRLVYRPVRGPFDFAWDRRGDLNLFTAFGAMDLFAGAGVVGPHFLSATGAVKMNHSVAALFTSPTVFLSANVLFSPLIK